MRNKCLRLSLALLFVAFLPLGCADESASPKGTGGSGGSARGGSGGTSSSGGAAGSGGSSVGGSGGKGGSGGSQAGGTGGSGGAASGGAGGQAGRDTGTQMNGGSGGQATGGGGGGTSARDGSPDTRSDARASDGSEDSEPAREDVGGEAAGGGTCDDKKQDGNETDTDCGGGECPKCGAGLKCKVDGDCRSGKCTSEKCADPFAADGQVTLNGNRWQITIGTLLLEVGTDQAAMITAFSIDGINFLVKDNASNGSVFWTAPQSDWNWPPPSEMDSASYNATSANNVLTMTGPVGSTDKLSITKRFWGNVANQVVTIEYTIKNNGTAAVQKAPWEISRVYPKGLTFFPNSEPPVVLPGTSGSFKEVPFTEAAGAAWWKYQTSAFTQDIKGGANASEGWAAQINCGTGLEQSCPTSGSAAGKSTIFIKQWVPSTKIAPEEKEVEIYANSGHNYVEFEQQGDYQSIPAGGSITWTIHWMLRYLPSTVTPTVGNQALLDWVRSQLL
jgi:hypothetical protein